MFFFFSLFVQECVGRVCDLTGYQPTDVKLSVLEQVEQQRQEQVSPDLTSESPLTSGTPTSEAVSVETVDEGVVKSYSKLISVLAAVGVALLAIAVWFVYSMQQQTDNVSSSE